MFDDSEPGGRSGVAPGIGASDRRGDASAVSGPDPHWSAAELLAAAERAPALTAAWLGPLAALAGAELTAGQRVVRAVVMDRLAAVAETLALRALAEVDRQRCSPGADARACPGGSQCAHDWEADELAVLMRLSFRGVRRRRRLAGELFGGRLAAVGPLLEAGRVSVFRARMLSDRLEDVDDATAEEVVSRVVKRMPQQTPAAFSKAMRRAVLACTSPEAARAARIKADRTHTGITQWDLDDGLAALRVTAPAEIIEATRAIVRSHPEVLRPAAGDARTVGQRETDVLLDLVLAGAEALGSRRRASESMPQGGVRGVRVGTDTAPAADGGSSGDARAGADPAPAADGGSSGDARAAADMAPAADGRSSGDVRAGVDTLEPSPHVQVPDGRPQPPQVGVIVTTSAEVLLGLSNEPGWLGVRPIHAEHVRQLCSEPDWVRRALLNDKGVVVDLGRKQRFGSPSQRIALGVRSLTCEVPGCDVPGSECQIDHQAAWEQGGRTDFATLELLCARHHRMKHQVGWRLERHADGVVTWTLPHGAQVARSPMDHRPAQTPFDGYLGDGALSHVCVDGLDGSATRRSLKLGADVDGPPDDGPVDDYDGDYDDWLMRVLASDPRRPPDIGQADQR